MIYEVKGTDVYPVVCRACEEKEWGVLQTKGIIAGSSQIADRK